MLSIAQREQWDFIEGREWNSSREKCLNKDLWNVLVLGVEMNLILLGKIGRSTLPSAISGSDHSLLGQIPTENQYVFLVFPQIRDILLRCTSCSLYLKKWYKYLLFEIQCNIGYAFYKTQRTFKDPPFRLWLIVNLPPHLKIIRVYLGLRYVCGEPWELILGSLGQTWQLVLSGHRRKG